MGSINSYKELLVWQNAMELAEQAYVLTRRFPKEEPYGLVSQIRRAATSIAANIAEVYGREHTGSFIQFLRIVQGSLKELETHLMLSTRIGLIDQNSTEKLLELADILGKRLRALIRSLQKR